MRIRREFLPPNQREQSTQCVEAPLILHDDLLSHGGLDLLYEEGLARGHAQGHGHYDEPEDWAVPPQLFGSCRRRDVSKGKVL